jgi:maltooligosyltrehalose trehalohydrolase
VTAEARSVDAAITAAEGSFVGALPVPGGVWFRLWAPTTAAVRVHLLDSDRYQLLLATEDGYHEVVVPDCQPGTRYLFELDGKPGQPDPASRFQPQGVHGPSEVVDLAAFAWTDTGYRQRPFHEHVISEVHIGTLTSGGTFDDAIASLDALADLGITAVEVMPVAQFPGRRNWGYDGVFPFAVQESYGGPVAFQRFVDACHDRRLAVVLDVVYNHLGPEGNILGQVAPYFTDRYRTPWGQAVNFDGPHSDDVRSYFLRNACQWLDDFHVDALRLDAVHEFLDRTATPFLVDLSRTVEALGQRNGRRYALVAESADNDPRLVTPTAAGGLGLDGQWNDDFHHALHVTLTGEQQGYYADYRGLPDLAIAATEGFVYQGGYSTFRQRRHGAPLGGIPSERFVVFAQNHDHIGNRPAGDRLVTLVPFERIRVAAALLLLSPGIPLLFMGEEYGDPAPFPYFVDHGDPDLLEAVRRGRAQEFAALSELGQPFDPADVASFESARVNPGLRVEGDHAHLLALYRDLISLRVEHPALGAHTGGRIRSATNGTMLTLTRLNGPDAVVICANAGEEDAMTELPDQSPHAAAGRWELLIDSGAASYGRPATPLPATLHTGAMLSLAPWSFGAYRSAGNPDQGASQ